MRWLEEVVTDSAFGFSDSQSSVRELSKSPPFSLHRLVSSLRTPSNQMSSLGGGTNILKDTAVQPGFRGTEAEERRERMADPLLLSEYSD